MDTAHDASQEKLDKRESEMGISEPQAKKLAGNGLEQTSEEKASILDQKKVEQLYLYIKAILVVKLTKTDNQPAKVLENLYLGSIGAAMCKATLEQFGIKKVLSALDKKTKEPYADLCDYKFIQLQDTLTETLQSAIEHSNEYIH